MPSAITAFADIYDKGVTEAADSASCVALFLTRDTHDSLVVNREQCNGAASPAALYPQAAHSGHPAAAQPQPVGVYVPPERAEDKCAARHGHRDPEPSVFPLAGMCEESALCHLLRAISASRSQPSSPRRA